MRVSLKRADFYSKAALKAATESAFDTTLRLSVYSPELTAGMPGPVIVARDVAAAKVNGQLDLSLALIAAHYAIREFLANANMAHGISRLLTRNKMLAGQEGRLRAFLKEDSTEAETSPEATMAKAEAARSPTAPSGRYGLGREDHVLLSVVDESTLADIRRRLKRVVDERSVVSNELDALNVTNHIDLDDKTIATLRQADLLPE